MLVFSLGFCLRFGFQVEFKFGFVLGLNRASLALWDSIGFNSRLRQGSTD